MREIRKAKVSDIPKIMDLLYQVASVHHEGRPDLFKSNAAKYSEIELEKIIKDSNTPVFVSVSDKGDIEGHAFCVFKEEKSGVLKNIKTLYIDDICVDKNARKKGVGSGLFDFLEKFAKNNDCYNLTLNVWACNPSALKFYEKCGLFVQKIGMEKIL